MINIKLNNGKLNISKGSKITELEKFELAIQDFIENVGRKHDVYLSKVLVNSIITEDSEWKVIKEYKKILLKGGWMCYTMINDNVIFFKTSKKKMVDDVIKKLDMLSFNDISAFDSQIYI